VDMHVPCVVFAFNRPEKLVRVLTALQQQNIDSLVVFVDGPRHDADVPSVRLCKAIAEHVDWTNTELHFGEQNQGLPGLADNITLVLNEYPSAVFLEDDCLPMPGFYSFMHQALAHYKSFKEVFSIGGYQPISQAFFENYQYSLVSCARFMCWGWATWKHQWESIASYRSSISELFDGLRNVPDVAGSDMGNAARGCVRGEGPKTWAVQVAVAALWLRKVHLLPTRGLVRNIGFDGSGVHDTRYYARLNNQNVSEKGLEKIVWLENVELNEEYIGRFKEYIKAMFEESSAHR